MTFYATRNEIKYRYNFGGSVKLFIYLHQGRALSAPVFCKWLRFAILSFADFADTVNIRVRDREDNRVEDGEKSCVKIRWQTSGWFLAWSAKHRSRWRDRCQRIVVSLARIISKLDHRNTVCIEFTRLQSLPIINSYNRDVIWIIYYLVSSNCTLNIIDSCFSFKFYSSKIEIWNNLHANLLWNFTISRYIVLFYIIKLN